MASNNKTKNNLSSSASPAKTASPPSESATAFAGVSSSKIHLTAAKHNGAKEYAVDLSKTWAIVKKNWLVLKGDKVRLFPLILMPMIMIVIFGYASGNLPKHLSTAIVDYDQSTFSHDVTSQIATLDSFSIKYQVGTQDEAKKLLDAGKVKVIFILPAGLGDQVASGQPAQINLMVDESDSSVAQAGKGAALAFSQSLTAQIAQKRLGALTAQVQAARQTIAQSNQITRSISNADPNAALDSSQAMASDAATLSAKSGGLLSSSILSMQNALGYLIDQNEVLAGYGPGSLGSAALEQLATGDTQQSQLQQIALYQSLLGVQTRLGSDVQRLAGTNQMLAGQINAQSQQAQVAVSLQDAAGSQLELISNGVPNAGNGISISILQPYGYDRRGIDFLLPSILALVIFQGAVMGLGRAIAGERKDGSLTRVFLTPTSNVTIIVGTQIFYLLLETIRSSLIIFVAILLFGVTISGSLPDIIFIIALFALGATGVGMVLSVMTKTQEQYMALGMMVSMPMMFLSGAFFPVQTMPPVLQSVAEFLPVTYAADAMRGVMVKGFSLAQVLPDLLALAIFGLFTITLSLMLFKRELV